VKLKKKQNNLSEGLLINVKCILDHSWYIHNS